MTHHVTFYSPDTHILYDGRTPYRKGVGGGITARIRMARALQRAGHRVTLAVNCGRRTRVDGVDYIPLREVHEIDCDILILNTSGGPLDLSPILELEVRAGLKAVWTSGTPRPGGLDQIGFDFIYAKSNFLRQVVMEQWGVPEGKIFVAYNGFEAQDFIRAERRPAKRDPHRLVYFSHPSKGLDTAVAVLQRLRRVDPRFHLHIYGGHQLWGQEEADLPGGEGVHFHGLIGQRRLAEELLRCSYSVNLQDRLEPFGMVITESMRAGCVVLASPVGAYVELIRDGEDGFLVQGDHREDAVRDQAAALILKLSQNPAALEGLRRRAQAVTWDTDTMVRVWEGHWRWWFQEGQDRMPQDPLDRCPHCGARRLWLADGTHCLGCGRYAAAFR